MSFKFNHLKIQHSKQCPNRKAKRRLDPSSCNVGIRNAVVGMFNPLNLRDDKGKIWENYIISEIQKCREYQRRSSRFYFWRTYDRKEIDLIEEQAGKLSGYEIKWKQGRARPPKDWHKYYPTAGFEVIHNGNYLNYILKQSDER